ncbi:unnamed protein product [Symbiodinium sp. KB8]|nr:unnamed protein product [Symbiodinium sp. KB8]
MDLLQAKQKNLLNRDSERVDLIKETASEGAERLKVLKKAVSTLSKNIKTTGGHAALEQIKGELSRLEVEVIGGLERFATWPTGEDLLATERLPPGLLSSLVDNKLVSDDFLAEVTRQKTLTNRVVRRTQSLILASIWDAADLTGTPVHQASRFDAWAGLGHDLMEGALRLRDCEGHVPIAVVDNDDFSFDTARHRWNAVSDGILNSYHGCVHDVVPEFLAHSPATKLCDLFKRIGATARVTRCKANKRKAEEPTMDNQDTLVMQDASEELDDGSDHASENSDGASSPDDAADGSEDLGSADEDDEATFRARFESFSSEEVDGILQSIKSHELFPFFEEFQIGSAEYHSEKSMFGSVPVEDVLSWNDWLEQHGEALSQYAMSTAAAKAKLLVLSEPAQGEAADEAAGAVEDASHTKEDDDEHDDDRGESGGPAACEDDGADGDASPVGDRDGSQESGASDDEFAYLEELVTHAREFLMDDDSLAAGSSKRRLDFADNDDGCDIKKEEKKDGPEFVPSSFRASGLPAADINKVQKAALESVKHHILSPQEQLDLIKNERAKKAAAAPKKGKCAGNGYFVYWAPAGTLYTIRSKAEKDGFEDDDEAITRVVEGEVKIQQSRLAKKNKDKVPPPPPLAEESESSEVLTDTLQAWGYAGKAIDAPLWGTLPGISSLCRNISKLAKEHLQDIKVGGRDLVNTAAYTASFGMHIASLKSGCLGLPPSGSAAVDVSRRKKGKTMDESKCLEKLVKMGFDRDAACIALADNRGDATKAVLALVAAEKAGLKKPAETSNEKPEATSKSNAKKPKTATPASSEKLEAEEVASSKKLKAEKTKKSSAVKPTSSEKPEAKPESAAKIKAKKPVASPQEPPSKRTKKTQEEPEVDMVKELAEMLDEVKATKEKEDKKETKEKKDKKETKEKKDKKETKEKKDKKETKEKEEKEDKKKIKKDDKKDAEKKDETNNAGSPPATPPPRVREPPASGEKVEKCDLRNLNPKSMAKFFSPDTYKGTGDAPGPCKHQKLMERQATVASIELKGVDESPEPSTQNAAASPAADLQVPYDEFCQKATLIEDDLKVDAVTWDKQVATSQNPESVVMVKWLRSVTLMFSRTNPDRYWLNMAAIFTNLAGMREAMSGYDAVLPAEVIRKMQLEHLIYEQTAVTCPLRTCTYGDEDMAAFWH